MRDAGNFQKTTTMTTETQLAPPELTLKDVLSQGTFQFFTIHDAGIQIADDCPEEDWLELAKQTIAGVESTGISHCRMMAKAADVLNHGSNRFGERYAQAIDATRGFLKMNAKTLDNAMWIFSKIPEERRRVDTLSLSHHEVVARLDADEQNEFLRTAEAEGMSVSALKEAVKERHPSKPRNGSVSQASTRDPNEEKIEEATALLAAQTVIDYFGQAEEEHGPASKWTAAQKAPWLATLKELVKIGRRTALKTHGKDK